jgi:acetyltransferase-like isoleucine patch superfamily enzyme
MFVPSKVTHLYQQLERRLKRDKHLSATVIGKKAFRYGVGLAMARIFLRSVDEVGEGSRTTGRPRIQNAGKMRFGSGIHVRSTSVRAELVSGPAGELIVGNRCSLNGCSIAALRLIQIGDRVRIGPGSFIIDSAFHDIHSRARIPEPKPVIIEDDAWIANRCIILPGVRIGKAAVVGSGAVVTRDVPPFTIVGGNPAKKIGEVDPERFIPEGDEEVEPSPWAY